MCEEPYQLSSSQDLKYSKEALLVGGLEAPLLWYRWSTSELHMEEDKGTALPPILLSAMTMTLICKNKTNNRYPTVIPKSAYTINVPVFYGAAQKDFICVPSLYLPALQKYAKGGLTIKDFPESDHWLPINKSREDLNNKLLEWIESIRG